MATTAKIEIRDGNPVSAIQDFLKMILAEDSIGAVLAPVHLPSGGTPMPTLVTDSDQLDMADPLAPAYPMNSGRMLARLTHGQAGTKIAAVLRSCEIRAFIELVKLNQASADEVLLISADCMGAFGNTDYGDFLGDREPMVATRDFLSSYDGAGEGQDVAKACKACEFPSAASADLVIGLAGADLGSYLPVRANTARGEALLNGLGLPDAGDMGANEKALEALVAARTEFRDKMFEETDKVTGSLNDLVNYLSGCINCYNCRVACPVCYCKECVFTTDVFEHKPWQYLNWAKQKGMLKMPTDTVFYHLTRLAHMSTACVGCGQCSNACPNDIPVMELFRTVAARTQAAFDYSPGINSNDPPPLSVFKEKEFPEVTAGTD